MRRAKTAKNSSLPLCQDLTRPPYTNESGIKTQQEATKTNPCGTPTIHQENENPSNATARLKENPYDGNVIGVGADFAKKTQVTKGA